MSEKEDRIVGFDTAEERHEVVLLDRDGKEELHFKCKNRRKALEDAFGKLMIRLGPDERLVVVLEAPRAHGRLVFEVASDFGLTVIQVGTVALNHFRECEGQPRKDDHWDAFLAARMAYLRTRGCHMVSDPRPEERVLSRLTRARSTMVRNLVAVKHQLRSILLELAPVVLDREWAGPAPTSAAMRKILKKWPAFEGLERSRRAAVEGILRSCRYRQDKRNSMIEALRKLAEEVVVSHEERAAMATEIDLIIRQWELLEKSIAELESKLEVLVRQHPVCVKLMKMPGIGVVTAAVLVGELFRVARNTTEASAATYSGLTPLSRKSGKSLNRSRLARGSNKHILNAMFVSSVKAFQLSALDRAYYDKKRADYQGHPKPHTAATLALARQRHKVIYQIMTTEAEYDKEILISAHLSRRRQASAA